jgi:hypothetical protein
VSGERAAGDDGASVQIVERGSGQLHIVITGVLATLGAAALQSAMVEALMAKPDRIHLDLTGLTDYTPVGIAALAACLSLAREVEGEVDVTVAGAAGRRALLRSLAAT